MKDVLKLVKAGHFAAITADELPAFLAAMDKNDARLFKPTRIALRQTERKGPELEVAA